MLTISPPVVSKDLDVSDVKTYLLDLSYKIFSIMVLPALVAAFFRVQVANEFYLFGIQLVFVTILWTVFIFRNKVKYLWRVYVLLITLCLNGVLSIYVNGFSSTGMYGVMLASILASTYLSSKHGWYVLAFLVVCLLAWAISSYYFELPNHIGEVSISVWVSYILSIVLFTSMALMMVGGLQELLLKMNNVVKENTIKIAENEKSLSSLIDLLPVAIGQADMDGNILYCNQSFTDTFGYAIHEVPDVATWARLACPDEEYRTATGAKWQDDIAKTIQTNEIQPARVYKVLCKNGEVKDIQIRFSLHEQSLIVVFEDMSEHIRYEELLLQKEERYRKVVEDQSEFIVRWKPDGTRIFVNNAYCRYLNRTEDDLLRTNFFEEADLKIKQLLSEMLSKMSPKNASFITKHSSFLGNGQLAWYKWTDTGLFDTNGKLYEIQSIGSDITLLVEAEQEEKNKTALLDAIIDNLPFDFWARDTNMVGIMQNGYSQKLWGALIGNTPKQQTNINNQLQERWIQNNQEALSGKIVDRQELYIAQDGREMYFREIVAPIRDENDQVTGIMGFNIDITEQKKSEQRLKLREEHFRLMVETMPVLINAFNTKGEFIYWNKACEQVTGYSEKEVLGSKDILLKLYPDEEYRKEKIDDYHNDWQGVKDIPIKLVAKDGSIKVVSWTNINIPVSMNEWDGWEVGVDITEQYMAQQALTESTQMLEQAQKVAHLGAWRLSFKSNMLRCNPIVYKILGIENREGLTLDEYVTCIHPQDVDIRNRHWQDALNGKSYEEVFRLHAPNNEVRWIKEIVKVFFNQDKTPKYAIGVLYDITVQKQSELALIRYRDELEVLVYERTNELLQLNEEIVSAMEQLHTKNEDLVNSHKEIQQLNEELKQTNEELSSTNEFIVAQKQRLQDTLEDLQRAQNQLVQSEKMAALGVLIAGVAHEINNPINFISAGIMGVEKATEAILENLNLYRAMRNGDSTLDFEQIRQWEEEQEMDFFTDELDLVITGIKTGVERTAQIIKSLRLFSHSNNEQKVQTDLNESIESVLIVLKNEYKYRIEIEKKYGELPEIYTYQGQINQVIMNIVSNAIQAISGNGIIRVETSYDKQKQEAIIKIQDTGSGMTNEVKRRIFDPFFTTKEVGKGVGLGMAISFDIINKHEGKIVIDSEPGNGTTFTLILPYGIDG